MIVQLKIKSRNPLNKAWTVETVKKRKVRRTEMSKYRIVTGMANQLEADARTTFRNQRQAENTYND